MNPVHVERPEPVYIDTARGHRNFVDAGLGFPLVKATLLAFHEPPNVG